METRRASLSMGRSAMKVDPVVSHMIPYGDWDVGACVRRTSRTLSMCTRIGRNLGFLDDLRPSWPMTLRVWLPGIWMPGPGEFGSR